MILLIDPELEALIPPLSEEELKQLRENILTDGRILDPIKCWEAPEGLTIVDGHNRYDTYLLHPHLPEPQIEILNLRTKDAVKSWMQTNQRGRRNLKPDQCLALDLIAGAELTKYSALKISKALAVRDGAPDLLEGVRLGKYGVEAAWNSMRLRQGDRTTTRSSSIAKPKPPSSRIHLVIGDTQVKPGVPTDHLRWIGQYIVDQFADRDLAVIHLGDHWDMPSLSSYDKGKRAMEGRRYVEDIEAGNKALELLTEPLVRFNKGRKKQWKPELHLLLGNHEARITRAVECDAALEGALSLEQLNAKSLGWTVHDFLDPLVLDGVSYAHYFIAKGTGKPLGGENAETRLKTVGTSFTMGHQQGRKWAEREIANGQRICALILGSTYLHDEIYLGPQGNSNWRGIVVCHQVENGQYDPMMVSLEFLCRKYEGQTLASFLNREKAA